MPSSRPTVFGILLFPGFEVLDVAGPMEVLNTLSRLDGYEDLRLHVIARTSPLDTANPAGPTAKGFEFMKQERYLPTCSLEDAPPLDVLFVPGGYGAQPHYCAAEIEFIRTVYPSLQYFFTVCNGSGLAAASGVLDGWRATSNKDGWKIITALSKKTYWVAKARWVVSGPRNNIWTTSGVSAGTDGMVAFVAAMYGEKAVEEILPIIEYTAVRNPADDPFATYYHCEDVKPVA